VGRLLEWEFIDGFAATPLGDAVCRHFLAPGDAFFLLDCIRKGLDPFDIVAEMELRDEY
jgi:helicase